MIKILRVITRLNIGGPAKQALLLSEAIRGRGFDTLLAHGMVSPGEGELPPGDGRRAQILQLQRAINADADLRALSTLTRLMRSESPHIVHTHMAKAGALGRLAARRTRVPVIVHTFHGHVLEGYFRRFVRTGFLAAERRLARESDVLIAVSPAIRDELLALRIGQEAQWRVIPVGLDLEELLSSELLRTDARRHLGLPIEGELVGIVGRLVSIKDHDTFFRAAARLAAARPQVAFVVVGDGDLRQTLVARGRELLGNRVHFTGWVSDLPPLYAALDVVALTSRNEGTPVSLIEAGAAARPVVSTRVGGVADVVLEGVTGILAPAGDDEAIAAAITRVLDNHQVAKAMGSAGREWVRERFSIERLASDLADLYDELLERKTGGKRRNRPGS